MEMPLPNVKALFDHVLEIESEAERNAYLDEACAGAPDTRRKVDALLKAYQEAGSFLESPAGNATAAFGAVSSAPEVREKPGTLVAGRYKLLELIGEGGMGVVFMAEQQEPVRRMVALKIIKPGMDSGQVLARFEAERQALALMDHPNIAKVLDGGATAEGRPFFVMELVKGTPITAFCDANKMSPRQRLELFIPVCQAIQHAHQKGIIHRDIKPSNVMIALYDDKPVPKVIDFGIAKAAGNPLTERTLHTGFGAIVGTPEYMSPEQATFNQLDIDTRSDVYSLGVLLYELLTGSTPVDKTHFKEAAVLEILRVVREEEPSRPSVKLSTTAARASIAATRGTEPDKLAQMLRGELDWIVMKSLEKDRNRRYETAAGLARDVDRYLKDELVEARPPSVSYRLRKFVKRHRGTVLTAGVVLLALLGGIVGTTWGLFEARRERDDADQARLDETMQRKRAQDNETMALAAEADANKALTHSVGLRLLLQSEVARPNDAGLAMLLAIEGAGRHPGLLANNTLLTVLDQSREERMLPTGASIICFSPDSHRLLTFYGWDIRIWDVLTGKELARFEKSDLLSGTLMVQNAKGEDTWYDLCYAACFDPDGKRVLTTSAFGRVRLWDAATGKALPFLKKGRVKGTAEEEADWLRNGHASPAPARFSPDGRFILTIDDKVRLWDAVSGTPQLVLEGHEGHVFWAEFSHDGRKIITASQDTTARIWDAVSGKQLQSFKGHSTNAFLKACLSPDGSRALTVASDSHDGVFKAAPCRLWNVQTGKELAALGGPGKGGALFNPDGSRVLTYDTYSLVEKEQKWHFWDASTGKHLGGIKTHWLHEFAAFSPDGERVALFGNGSQDIELWNAKTFERIETLHRHDSTVTKVLFSPDGQRLVRADPAAVYFRVIAGEAERKFGHWTQFKFLALSPDGRALATRSLDPLEVAIWDLATAREIGRVKGKGFSEAAFARFSPDGRLILFGDGGNVEKSSACVADVQTRRILASLPAREQGYADATISPDNLLVAASGDWNTRPQFWNLATAKEVAASRFGADAQCKGPARFSPDGSWLLMFANHPPSDRPLAYSLRDAATGKESAVLMPDLGPASDRNPAAALFSPDSRRVLTRWDAGNQSELASLYFWDTATGKKLAMVRSLEGNFGTTAFSNDGELLVTAGYVDRLAHLFETATGKELLILKGHDDMVNMASISPDKTHIVTASADKTARLWNASTGELLAVFHGHQEAVTFAQFIPEGRILSVDKNGSARVWPVEPLPTARTRAPRELTAEERKQYEVPTGKQR